MEFSELVGRTLESVDHSDIERIVFYFNDGSACESVHLQDCCESVCVNRIEGNVEDIIGAPILEAEQTHPDDPSPLEHPESWTWTRQRVRTAKGEVAFVWLGESNGYYGETPYFQITHGKEI